MLNVYELERQWFRYKVRYYLPLGVAILSVLLIIILGWIFWPDKDSVVQVTEAKVVPEQATDIAVPTEPKPLLKEISDTTQSIAVNKATQPKQHSSTISVDQLSADNKPTVMEPSLGFIQAIENEVQPAYEEEHVATEQVPKNLATIVPKTTEKISTPSIKIQQSVSEPAVVAEKQHNVSITQKDATDLQDVIKRFSTNKNPALSLFIARRYYDMGEYQHAYDYALQTNELDNDIEASWLIFAKSLAKLEKKDQAIKVLTSYINHSRSLRAKNLLEDIQSGKFK